MKQIPLHVWQGGETAGLARMAEHLADKEGVAAFEKPKGNPAAFKKAATTCLSPYLKFGCVSVRLFYSQLAAVCPPPEFTHSRLHLTFLASFFHARSR